MVDVEVVIDMAIKMYEEEELELLNDVYSPYKDLVPVMKEANYESLLVKNNSKVRVNDRIRVAAGQPEILQICHASGDIRLDDLEVTDSGLEVSGVMEVQILYICPDDKRPLNSIKGIIPFNQTIEARGIRQDSIYRVKPSLEQLSVMALDGEEMEVKAGIGLSSIIFNSLTEPIIADVEEHELDYDKLKSMPSMVGYVVKNNDSLWTIAKKYYSTVDKLKELNDLADDNVRPGEKLLITKRVDKMI